MKLLEEIFNKIILNQFNVIFLYMILTNKKYYLVIAKYYYR